MSDRGLPFLGPVAPKSHTGSCGFRSGPPGAVPVPPACLAEAAWHGVVVSDDGASLRTLLSCCTGHKDAMALTADFVHEYGTACALEESTVWWDGASGASGCLIDWDVTALRAGAEAAVTA